MVCYECRKAEARERRKSSLLVAHADQYPGAQGIRGLWRRCKTPKAMPFAQPPVKQECSFVRMRSPRISAWGDVTSVWSWHVATDPSIPPSYMRSVRVPSG